MKIYFLPILALFALSSNSQNLKPGDIDPNAAFVDATESSLFYEGFATVRKGDNYAIINKTGNFLVPYGTYQMADRYTSRLNDNSTYHFVFANGFCKVRDNLSGRFGMIDTLGKLFLPCAFYDIENFDDEGYCFIVENNATTNMHDLFYLNKKGIKIPVKSDYPRFYFNGLARTREGFINRKGEVKIKKGNFIDFNNFSDGLAAVSIKNDYGVKLWGFIDTTGKIIIPHQFKNEPGYFKNGLSKIRPENPDDYFYAFIDKTGKTRFSIRKSENDPNISSPAYYKANHHFNFITEGFYHDDRFSTYQAGNDGTFYNGYSFWMDSYYYDTMGNLTDLKKIMSGSELDPKVVQNLIIRSFDKEFFGVSAQLGPCGKGLISPAGKIILPLIFCNLSSFDKKSGLAYAEYESKSLGKPIKGFINKAGIFMLVLK